MDITPHVNNYRFWLLTVIRSVVIIKCLSGSRSNCMYKTNKNNIRVHFNMLTSEERVSKLIYDITQKQHI